MVWYAASLYRCSISHGVCQHLDIETQQHLSKILSREPLQHFSRFSAVFFQGRSFSLILRFFQKPPYHFSRALSIDSFPLQIFGLAAHLHFPRRHDHSHSSSVACYFQLPVDLFTSLMVFIFQKCNFNLNCPGRAEPPQQPRPQNYTCHTPVPAVILISTHP